MEGQVDDPLEMLKLARGGVAPREVIDVAVNPTGFPSASSIVITATPEAWLRKVCFRASTESWMISWPFGVLLTLLGYAKFLPE